MRKVISLVVISVCLPNVATAAMPPELLAAGTKAFWAKCFLVQVQSGRGAMNQCVLSAKQTESKTFKMVLDGLHSDVARKAAKEYFSFWLSAMDRLPLEPNQTMDQYMKINDSDLAVLRKMSNDMITEALAQ